MNTGNKAGTGSCIAGAVLAAIVAYFFFRLAHPSVPVYDMLQCYVQSNEYIKHPKSLRYLKAFLIQHSELTKLKNGLATPPFILNHLYGTDVIQAGESFQQVVELLKRYADEWDSVIADARRSGIAWTGFVGSEPNSTNGVSHVSA